MRPPSESVAMRTTIALRSRKLPRQAVVGASANLRKRALVVQVRLDVLAAFGESGHLEAPEVDAGEEVAAELAACDVVHEVAVRAADELEVAVLVLGGAERAVGLLLDCLEEHRLGLHRQLADLVEEDDAAVGLLEEADVVGAGTGERAFLVSEKGGLREVAAERRAVDGHEVALDLAGLLLEQVDLLGELALARAGGTGEQDGVGGAYGHAFDRLDEPVEVGVARGDALLEEGEVLLALGLEALGEHVVAREIEVDHVDHALGVVRVADVSLLRRGLHDLRVEVVRLDEQEEADLLHVRAGGDVDVVGSLLLVEAGRLGVVVELGVHLLEVPGVLQLNVVQHDLRLGGDASDVGLDALGEVLVRLVVDDVQFVDREFVLLDKPD